MPRKQLVSPTIGTRAALGKQLWAAAGFAPAQPVGKRVRFDGRRDGHIGVARPSARGRTRGKNSCPLPSPGRATNR